MQRDREVRDDRNSSRSPFDNFGLGGSMFPSIFGGRDLFDDPFFTRPFGSMFGSNRSNSFNIPSNVEQTSGPKGPLIQELDSDDEEMQEEKEESDANDAAWANKNPVIEHPEDQANGNGNSNSNKKAISHITNHNKVEGSQPMARSVSFQRVTYGGVNGAYYTATTTRKTGNGGATMEESKQADRTTGQATHRVSRGIHDKGHSVTRKLDSDGKVDTMQTLHNLNQDDLAGFERDWRGNAERHFHGWSDNVNFPERFSNGSGSGHGRLMGGEGFADPFREYFGRNRGRPSGDHNLQTQSQRGRPKKIVTINID